MKTCLLRVLAVVFILSICFLYMPCISVSASSRIMSREEFVSIVGNTIPFTYTIGGTQYHDVLTYAPSPQYVPQGVWTLAQNDVCNSIGSAQTYQWATYKCNSGSIPGYAAVQSMDIDLTVSFDNAQWGMCVIDHSNPSTSTSYVMANSTCQAGIFEHFVASDTYSDRIGSVYFNPPEAHAKFIPFYASGSMTSFNGIHVTNFESQYYNIIVIFMCPLYDDTFQTGVIETTSATTAPSFNVSVDVDMSETNGILSSISSALSGIADAILQGIRNIFLPDPVYLTTKFTQMSAKFGWMSQIKTAWETFYQTFSSLDFSESPTVAFNVSSFRSRTANAPYMTADGVVLDLSWYAPYRQTVHTLSLIHI